MKTSKAKCDYGKIITISTLSPIGEIHISSCPRGLHSLGQNEESTDENFSPNSKIKVALKEKPDVCYSPLESAIHWLKLYFEDSISIKDVNCPPLCRSLFKGNYRDKVWLTLMEKVDVGSTVSYSQLANLTLNPKAARSVGTAMKTNPIQLIIPCHRVICTGGNVGSYAGGHRNKTKRWLLEHEGIQSKNIN